MTTTRLIVILCVCSVFYAFGFVSGVYQANLVQSGGYRQQESEVEPFADGARREWKRGSRDIVWEREG